MVFVAIATALTLLVLSWLYVRGLFRQRQRFHLVGLPVSDARFPLTLASLSKSHLTQGAAVRFYSDISALQQGRLETIAAARHSIQFETFKMSPGKRADAFAAALATQARQGVQVQLLADSQGAKTLSKAYWYRLKNAGVDVQFFNPFSWRAPVDYLRRNHRKLLIVDQTTAIIGGPGISDFWDGQIPEGTDTPWFDCEVHWQGTMVSWLTGLFWQHWLEAGGRVDLQTHRPPAAADPPSGPVLITSGEDPTPQSSPIRNLVQACILSAQTRVWIASPYLLPEPHTSDMLAAARARGVDVRVLTMGPHTDKAYVYYTSREHYRPLLHSGIGLYEYQPSMMHAKIILVDHHWLSLGSANLDPRSFFHNDELNICTQDTTLIQQVEKFFHQGFTHSQPIDLATWQRRPWQQKLIGRGCNLVYWQF